MTSKRQIVEETQLTAVWGKHRNDRMRTKRAVTKEIQCGGSISYLWALYTAVCVYDIISYGQHSVQHAMLLCTWYVRCSFQLSISPRQGRVVPARHHTHSHFSRSWTGWQQTHLCFRFVVCYLRCLEYLHQCVLAGNDGGCKGFHRE